MFVLLLVWHHLSLWVLASVGFLKCLSTHEQILKSIEMNKSLINQQQKGDARKVVVYIYSRWIRIIIISLEMIYEYIIEACKKNYIPNNSFIERVWMSCMNF